MWDPFGGPSVGPLKLDRQKTASLQVDGGHPADFCSQASLRVRIWIHSWGREDAVAAAEACEVGSGCYRFRGRPRQFVASLRVYITSESSSSAKWPDRSTASDLPKPIGRELVTDCEHQLHELTPSLENRPTPEWL